MLPGRLLYVLFVALATLLMSFRPPVPMAVRQAILTENHLLNTLEMPVEEAQGSKNTNANNQQGPLEEIHDLHCLVNRQMLSLSLQATEKTNRLQLDVWMYIPVMSCFQPPEFA